MAREADLDLVSVVLRVPEYRAAVVAAYADAPGPHVFCEWPLGCDLADAEAIHQAALNSGAGSFIGLQARSDPVVGQARDVIGCGEIGDVLAVDVHMNGPAQVRCAPPVRGWPSVPTAPIP